MNYRYEPQKREKPKAPEHELVRETPSIDALRSGAVKPTQEQMGHRVDMPESMREKMENAFGADLSAVKLYESRAVEDAGAGAIAQGSNIVFAPGMLDFTSFGGQALLGHEISHVVSQARGEVTGSGFLNDHTLEARADREGAMAAAGQQISVPSAALSPVSAASASGPMQAGLKARREGNKKIDKLYRMSAYRNLGKDAPITAMPHTPEQEQALLYSLTDYELDMLQQRAIDADLKSALLDRDLQSNNHMSIGERMYRVGMSNSNTDSAIYKNLLSDFRGGPRFQTDLDDEDGETSFAKREAASNDRVMGRLSSKGRKRINDLRRQYDSNSNTISHLFGFMTSEDKDIQDFRSETEDSRKRYLRYKISTRK